jgi:cupin 2 domain-containing protein
MIRSGNLFAGLPEEGQGETFDEILRTGACRIERIISRGQASPSGFWYDQEANEWVLLIKGSATVGFADGRSIDLLPGDHLFIPRHERHRVEQTDPAGETLWLAVHFHGEPTAP